MDLIVRRVSEAEAPQAAAFLARARFSVGGITHDSLYPALCRNPDVYTTLARTRTGEIAGALCVQLRRQWILRHPLLIARAAWTRDVTGRRTTREAAMAKLAATEGAQEVIDRAVQLHGGRGVQSGQVVERLFRDIRALRIYEGATEIQKLIIGRDVLAAAATAKEGAGA